MLYVCVCNVITCNCPCWSKISLVMSMDRRLESRASGVDCSPPLALRTPSASFLFMRVCFHLTNVSRVTGVRFDPSLCRCAHDVVVGYGAWLTHTDAPLLLRTL